MATDWVTELVFVCDGATWIWELVARYYPNAAQIVDWYYAKDGFNRLAEVVFPLSHDLVNTNPPSQSLLPFK